MPGGAPVLRNRNRRSCAKVEIWNDDTTSPKHFLLAMKWRFKDLRKGEIKGRLSVARLEQRRISEPVEGTGHHISQEKTSFFDIGSVIFSHRMQPRIMVLKLSPTLVIAI